MNTNRNHQAFGIRNRYFLLSDILILAVLPWIALLARVESVDQLFSYARPLAIYSCIMLAWKPLVIYLSGIYERYWPYASTDAMIVLVTGTFTTMLIEIFVTLFVVNQLELITPPLPRSLPFLNGALCMMGLMSTRLGVRLAAQYSRHGRGERRQILIVGAGIAGSMVAREFRHTLELKAEPVGFLDDDPKKHGLFIHDVPVLGPLSMLASIVGMYHVVEVIIAIPSASGSVVRKVDQECKKVGVKSRIVPGIFEILDGTAKVTQLRDIEVEDLLRRGVVHTDMLQLSRVLADQRVLVTGAGGSIGGELCRQIIGCRPSDLILLGHGENSIFTIANEIRKHANVAGGDTHVYTVIADMRDEHRMERVFKRHRPQIVFHAAAHKHVGLMEGNLQDAVSNNVLGTQTLVDFADRFGTERFVMISSDKAVNPTSVMGVTKRIAELIVQERAICSRKAFVSVRFGNVLGSRGSVVPIFKAQVAAGGPVIVTHPLATRFFMTIPEAVQLVLQAGAMGKGGEVFVLDMGDPIRIVDLARDIIRLSGLKAGDDIDIQYSGLAWGEKLHEELFYQDEEPVRSSHEKIFVCKSRFQQSLEQLLLSAGVAADPRVIGNGGGMSGLCREVDRLIVMATAGEKEEALSCIRRIVPQFTAGGDALVPEAAGKKAEANG